MQLKLLFSFPLSAVRFFLENPSICIFSVTWLAGDVKEPTHLSERVGDEIPGVVVYLSFHAWVGWVSEIKKWTDSGSQRRLHKLTFDLTQ